MPYQSFRSGLTYRDVWQMLADDSEDKTRWRYKRRHTVLGFWRALKLDLWEHHKCQCEAETAQELEGVPF